MSRLETEFMKLLISVRLNDHLTVLYTLHGIKEDNQISHKLYAAVYLLLGRLVYKLYRVC